MAHEKLLDTHTLSRRYPLPKAMSRKSGESDPALQHFVVLSQSQTFDLAF